MRFLSVTRTRFFADFLFGNAVTSFTKDSGYISTYGAFSATTHSILLEIQIKCLKNINGSNIIFLAP